MPTAVAFPSVEVMVTNARIQDLIREDRPDEITDAIAAGEFFQMQTFAQSLIELVLSGAVEREVAANSATNRHDFLVALERAEKEKAARAREDAVAGAEAETPASSSPDAPNGRPPGETQPGLQALGATLR